MQDREDPQQVATQDTLIGEMFGAWRAGVLDATGGSAGRELRFAADQLEQLAHPPGAVVATDRLHARAVELRHQAAIADLVATQTAMQVQLANLEARMSELTDVIAEIDTETTRIATKVEELTARIASGDTAAAAELRPLAARLRTIGADPTDPVPVLPPGTDPGTPPV